MNIINIKSLFFVLGVSALLVSCANDEKELPISEIYLDIPDDGYEVKVNDTIEISPKITYDYGSTYTWILNDEIISKDKNLVLIPKELETFTYTFIVENSRGAVSREIIAQSMYISDFEDQTLEEDTFSVGEIGSTLFTSSLLNFELAGDPRETTDFNGFLYSSITGTSTNVLEQLYGAYRTPDDYESDNYAVIGLSNPESAAVITTADNENHLFKSMYVENTYYNYLAIENGTEYSKKFGGDEGTDPDWFKLIITGFDKSGAQQGEIEFFLADHTATINKDDYTIQEWTNVDLTDLGYVSRIEISFSSTDTNNGIVLTPAYVCLDNIKIID